MDNFITSIHEGKTVDNLLGQKLHDALAKAAAKLEPEKGQSVFQRIQQARGVFDWSQVESLIPQDKNFGKCAATSDAFREKGNEFYKQRNAEGALRAYTLAIAFAPKSSQQLITGYANRSAVLLSMKHLTKEALEDVNRAISGCKDAVPPPNLPEKLKERGSKCEELIKTQTSLETKSVKGVERLFEIGERNEKVPNAQNFVSIDYSQVRGRHLIVTQDVPAGTPLLLDQPFVNVLNNLLSWETDHCHNCLKQTLNGIPCDHCTFTLFCSESCRNKACNGNGSHRFEHNYLHILQAFNSSHADIQSLRILALVGHQELYRLYKTKNPLYFNNTTISQGDKGFSQDGVYSTESYLPIFHLISHSQQLSDAAENTMRAVFLKELLKRHSNFFRKPLVGQDIEEFISALILKHLENIRYNAISQSKLVTQGKSAKSVAYAYAAAIYPLLSLCNHSCDPNCAPVKKSQYLVTSLLALKHLNKGDELFISYKPLYTQMKTVDRQRFLAENYKFICSCAACDAAWGPATIEQVAEPGSLSGGATLILEPAKCDSCSGGRQCHQCVLQDLAKAKELKEMEESLFECHDLLSQQDYYECLQRLPRIVDYFGEKGYVSHFPLYNVALDLFKRALVYSVSNL